MPNRGRPAAPDELPAEGLARLSGEVAQLSALVARVADDVSHLDALATVLRSDQKSLETRMVAIDQTVRHVEDAVVAALGSKIESAVSDLLAALDHELSEQYERSVLESHRVTESLERLTTRGSEGAAPLRKALTEMSRTLRTQMGEQLERHGERHDALDAAAAQLLAEVTALKRRIPLRAGDAELSAGERERLAASIARLLLEEQPPRKRAAKSSRSVAASPSKAPATRRRPPVG
jgi:chromosome segregation ATPase